MRLKITSAYRIRLFHLHTGCLRFLLTAIFLSCIKSYAYGAKLESIYFKNADGLASFYPTQETEVSGVVYDELGTPLPGASVVIVGSKGGVITDFDGQFKIKLKPGDKLQISYVGLKTTIIEYSDQKNLEIHMEANMNALDDVTIVAFAKQKQEDVIGAITTIKPEDLKIPSSNFTNSFAGRVPGMVSYQRSGEPGQNTSEFYIRGITTFGYKRDPLY